MPLKKAPGTGHCLHFLKYRAEPPGDDIQYLQEKNKTGEPYNYIHWIEVLILRPTANSTRSGNDEGE